MDGNGTQFVKGLWIGLGEGQQLKTIQRYGTFIKHVRRKVIPGVQ